MSALVVPRRRDRIRYMGEVVVVDVQCRGHLHDLSGTDFAFLAGMPRGLPGLKWWRAVVCRNECRRLTTQLLATTVALRGDG